MVNRNTVNAIRKRPGTGIFGGLAVVCTVALGCSAVEIIGYRIPGGEDTESTPETYAPSDSEPPTTERPSDTMSPAETEPPTEPETESTFTTDTVSGGDSDGGRFPMIFDFEDGNDGFYGNPASWTWNSAEGTFDLDIVFTTSPAWQSLELYAGAGIWPGGADWTGATSVEYRYRTLVSNGGFFRAFFQSIEQESAISETWLWYDKDQELVQDGVWRTVTLDLSAPLLVNIEEVTKVGLQIHGIELPIPSGDLETEIVLPEPEHVVIQVDSVIVR